MHDGREQSVVVDLAEARTAVLVLGPVAVVLDRERPHVADACRDVGDRVVALVVEDVAGVVAHAHALVADLTDDRRAHRAGGRVAAVLLDQHRDAGLTRRRSDGLQAGDDAFVLAWTCPPERQQIGNLRRRSLRDAPAMRVSGIGFLEEDRREHHHRIEPAIPAAPCQRRGLRRRRVHVQGGPLLSAGVLVGHAPGDVGVASGLDPLERPLHGEGRIRQRHARHLKRRRAATSGCSLAGGRGRAARTPARVACAGAGRAANPDAATAPRNSRLCMGQSLSQEHRSTGAQDRTASGNLARDVRREAFVPSFWS